MVERQPVDQSPCGISQIFLSTPEKRVNTNFSGNLNSVVESHPMYKQYMFQNYRAAKINHSQSKLSLLFFLQFQSQVTYYDTFFCLSYVKITFNLSDSYLPLQSQGFSNNKASAKALGSLRNAGPNFYKDATMNQGSYVVPAEKPHRPTVNPRRPNPPSAALGNQFI